MINELELHNMKCFLHKSLRLGSLTLLTGLNSAGKSTIIQSLLLAELAIRVGDGQVPLLGQFGLALGNALDVLNRSAETKVISITKRTEAGDEILNLEVVDDMAFSLTVSAHRGGGPDAARIGAYLSAERLGPRDAQEASAQTGDEAGVGHQGQFTAQVLSDRGRQTVSARRRFPTSDQLPITLQSQTEAWLSRVVRPIQVEANRIAGTSLATLRFKERDVSADWVRPTNVGFGLSYALPVIVAGLSVTSGSTLLVENPEAHLHPAGQSWIGEFLTRVAGDGVQVVVETHSDHVLNGVRRAVAVEGALPNDELVIHFFGARETTEIRVGGHGALSAWPEAFFDQPEMDLTDISRASRGR